MPACDGMRAAAGSGKNGPARVRLLGLGNEILADDAFGIVVAREVDRLMPREVEVVCSSAAGFNLMDDLLGASRLVVVDTIMTGTVPPGTIHIFEAEEMEWRPCVAPHCLGLLEVLAVGRRLRLEVPAEISVVAVEAADCTTIGGAMGPEVQSAIAPAVGHIRKLVEAGGP